MKATKFMLTNELILNTSFCDYRRESVWRSLTWWLKTGNIIKLSPAYRCWRMTDDLWGGDIKPASWYHDEGLQYQTMILKEFFSCEVFIQCEFIIWKRKKSFEWIVTWKRINFSDLSRNWFENKNLPAKEKNGQPCDFIFATNTITALKQFSKH